MTLGPLNITPFTVSFAFYFAGMVSALGAAALGRRARALLGVAYAALAAGGIAHTVLFLQRWIIGGYPPLSGLFDAVVFFAWTSIIVFGIAETLFRTRWLALFVGVLEVALFAYAADCDPTIRPLMPVLKSTWLVIHVFAYMTAYSIMAIACFNAILFYGYLNAQGESEQTRRFDSLVYRLVAFGFPLLTVGILTGAVWANRTWGRYWGWDIKETWSLITWIAYAVYLHLRFWSRGWAMPALRRSASLNWLALLGFLFILVTFLFLKYLPAAQMSKHVYL